MKWKHLPTIFIYFFYLFFYSCPELRQWPSSTTTRNLFFYYFLSFFKYIHVNPRRNKNLHITCPYIFISEFWMDWKWDLNQFFFSSFFWVNAVYSLLKSTKGLIWNYILIKMYKHFVEMIIRENDKCFFFIQRDSSHQDSGRWMGKYDFYFFFLIEMYYPIDYRKKGSFILCYSNISFLLLNLSAFKHPKNWN